MIILAVAVRRDRLLVWRVVTALLVLQLIYAVVACYPMVAAARALVVLDGVEGVVFVGLLSAALVLCIQRLTGVTDTPAASIGAPTTVD